MGRMWVAVGLVGALVSCDADGVHGRADSGEPIDAARRDGGADARACGMVCPGNGTRFVELALSKPDTLPALINPVLADVLRSGDMIILVAAEQTTPDDFRLYTGLGGVSKSGSFHFTGECVGETIAHLDPAGFISEPFTWSICGLTEAPIIIFDTVISMGELDTDSGVHLVKGGTLTGVLTPENAMMVILSPDLTLYAALVGFGVETDVDRDDDGVNESWEWIAAFNADPVWIFPRLPVAE